MLSSKKKEHNTIQPGSINVVGADTVVEGNIVSKGDIRIDGTLIGSVKTSSKLVLGASGKIEGDLEAKSADISGKIKGNLKVSEILYLQSSSSILGDIVTDKLVVESGGEFNGKCEMGKKAIPIDSANKLKEAIGQ
ncbi:MAG: polymer-forming cytoskeletal protein [Flavobacteriales bacterium]|nr:polymer-forming cytoskeletal protein [Flavobacteriales bacterium]